MLVVAGVVMALVFGRSVIASFTSIRILVLVFVAMEKWKAPTGPGQGTPAQLNTDPFTFIFRWHLDEKPDLPAIQQSLMSYGLRPEPSSANADLAMRGGSQLWTRLFGGYFVALRRLPVRAELNAVSDAGDTWRLELKVSDRFGLAIRNAAREKRPEMAAIEIRDAVEGLLGRGHAA